MALPNVAGRKEKQTAINSAEDLKKNKKFFKNPLTNEGFCGIIIIEIKERGNTK